MKIKKRIFMIGYSTDKGGIEAYIDNVTPFLKEDFEIINRWPVMEIDGKVWVAPKSRRNPLKYYFFWKKFFTENKFDALYFNTCDILSIDVLKFAKRANIPVRIIHSHSFNSKWQGNNYLLTFFHKLSEKHSRKNLHRYATHLLACSQKAGDWMFDGRPFKIIQNGINLNKYQFSSNKREKIRKKIGNNHPVIAFIGRLDTEKNPLFAYDIFKNICSSSHSNCIFIGDGEFRHKLELQAKSDNLSDRIIFTGAINNVDEWLSAIDALVMPSFFEGLPFSLIEAQAAGIHGLVSENVSQEANITGLVKFKELREGPEEWAKELIDLAKLPRESKIKELESAGFSIESTADTIKSIINGDSL